MNEFPHFLDYARRQRDCWTDIVAKLEAVEPLAPASSSTNGAKKPRGTNERNERTNERTSNARAESARGQEPP